MSTSPRLSLPLLMPQQAQRHLTLNDAFRLLDVLVQTAVVSDSLAVEPEDAGEGDLFILPSGATGARWGVMQPGALAMVENGAFVEMQPVPGQIAYVADRRALVLFDGEAWGAGPFAASEIDRLGINALPTDANRLTVAADAELLTFDARTPGSGDARKVINRQGAGRVASVLFQTGFSGRAEIGLLGDERFSIRLSTDGASFTPILTARAADGFLSVAHDSEPVCALDVGGAVRVATYLKAALPSAEAGAGQIILVSDAAGGAVLAFSDGAAWRRVTDRAIVT
ncbi:DUF2793 domain-containing protein [Aureimonas phyllosphaerae]|uniref:DUF2793 domain-containing protein n=1 Tax=Aureimonas phyllosphaerae TaxID=1166078 RepID=A0A7W6BQM1_9HYPH|nr:DUF2793 domain-containing protein [Aureimonas phyllosphaerae]MBB3934460.1 hypothetical protein [Aureimonas phyllosphaerae]MBB3958324.1 hypothetical protein [Aureimonas phyllosphaerae]SFE95312.1 Protein of unknown function [Aureimonas phyllosphaerae]